MKERPILMKAEGVRATLEDRKTQTRRIDNLKEILIPDKWTIQTIKDYFKCRWEKGMNLWVRETWGEITWHELGQYIYSGTHVPNRTTVVYRAGPHPFNGSVPHGWNELKNKWHPSIHMPRWASRIELEITNIRVERIQDISEEDAIAEGIAPLFSESEIKDRPEFNLKPMPFLNYLWHGNHGKHGTGNKKTDAWEYQYSSYKSARDSFSSLWELTYGPGAWDRNDWVWVIDYKRIKPC